MKTNKWNKLGESAGRMTSFLLMNFERRRKKTFNLSWFIFCFSWFLMSTIKIAVHAREEKSTKDGSWSEWKSNNFAWFLSFDLKKKMKREFIALLLNHQNRKRRFDFPYGARRNVSLQSPLFYGSLLMFMWHACCTVYFHPIISSKKPSCVNWRLTLLQIQAFCQTSSIVRSDFPSSSRFSLLNKFISLFTRQLLRRKNLHRKMFLWPDKKRDFAAESSSMFTTLRSAYYRSRSLY